MSDEKKETSFNHDAYVAMLEQQWYHEQQENCPHPDEEWEFGKLNWVNNFHGYDQRVTCKLCGYGWWW
jgi:hypothetical protein